jgi:NADH-quinone oxidoreductase subunit G
VLDALADEMDVELRLRDVDEVRAEAADLAGWEGAPAPAPAVPAPEP